MARTNSSAPADRLVIACETPVAFTMVWLTYVAAKPGGDLLAVADGEGVLRVWLPIDNRIVAMHPLGASINKAAWTASGEYLIATSGDALHVFSHDGTDRIATIETGHDQLRWFAAHPSRPSVATTGGDGRVRLWDLANQAMIREVLVDHAKSTGTAIAMTEQAIVVGYESGRFSACDHEDRWITSGKVFDGPVSALAASSDGASVLAACGRGGMFRMDTTTSGWPDRESWQHPPRPISTNTIEIAAGGRFVTALSDDTAVVYRSYGDALGTTLGTAFWLDRKPWEQAYIVSAACFVPNTALVATTHFTGHLTLWNLEHGRATVQFVDDQPRWDGVDDPVRAWSELVARTHASR